MGELRRHRWLIGWVAMLAMVGNIVASALCCAPRSHGENAAEALGLFGPLVICTAEGVKTLVPGGAGPAAPGDPAKPSCPVCVLLATSVLAIAFVLIGILALRPDTVVRLRPDQQRPAGQLPGHWFESRGPPALA